MSAFSHRRTDAHSVAAPPHGEPPSAALTLAPSWSPAVLPASGRCIGWSAEGRAIDVRSFGPPWADVRIAIVAGQHGDERLASVAADEAVRRFTSEATDRQDAPTRTCRVEFVRVANPDGATQRRRTNAHGIDLNRDHLSLEAPETRSLHTWLARFRPHVVVDVHAYPSRRSWLNARGWCHAGDVCIDWSSCPASDERLRRRGERIGRSALAATVLRGWRADRYLVASGRGVLRPSSPTPVTLLNAAAVRFGAIGLLVEAREPAAEEDPGVRDRSSAATTDAIVAIMRAATARADGGHESLPAAPTRVSVGGRWSRDGKTPRLWIRGRDDRRVRHIEAPGRARTGFQPSDAVEVPSAYGLPITRWSIPIMQHLARLGVEPTSAPPRDHRIERPVVTSLDRSRRADRALRRLRVRWETASPPADPRWWWWAVDGSGDIARTLVLLLDPESRYGLVRDGRIPVSHPTGGHPDSGPAAPRPPTLDTPRVRVPIRRARAAI